MTPSGQGNLLFRRFLASSHPTIAGGTQSPMAIRITGHLPVA